MIKRYNFIIICVLAMFSLFGCRGWKTEKPPVHPNINFDFQPKIKAQTDPRPIPEHTVQYNKYANKNLDKPLNKYNIDDRFMNLGQKNYNIYCSACHTKTGNGTKSIISKQGWIVSNILDDVTYLRSDEEIYDIIENGIRSMPGYGSKLSDEEIWQIVLYVRALQKTTRLSKSDINLIEKWRSE